MKKILIAYGILVVVVIILAFAKFNGASFPILGGNNNAEVTVAGQTYDVEVADDDRTRQVGLSNRKSLGENNGMLFVFEKKGKYSFWMKETLIPLDIIFINDNKIVYIVNNAQPDKGDGAVRVFQTPQDANYVLELNASESEAHNIKVGDTVSYSGI